VSQAPRSSLPVYSRSVWAERGRYWAAQAVRRVPELDGVTAGAFAKWMAPAAAELVELEPERETVTVAATAATPVKKTRALDRILEYLAGRPEKRAHTGVIAQDLEMPMPTVSTTLRRAVEAGAPVEQVREGIWAVRVEERENELVAA
jgi:hypothetical protein